MKVFIVFAAICFLAVAMAQVGGNGEGDEYGHGAAIREARGAKGILFWLFFWLYEQLYCFNIGCKIKSAL